LLSLCGRQSERVSRSFQVDIRLVLLCYVHRRQEVLVDVDMLLLLVDPPETLLFLLGDDWWQGNDALRSSSDGADTLRSARGGDEGGAILLSAAAQLDVVGELDSVVSWGWRIGETLLVEFDVDLFVIHDVGGRGRGERRKRGSGGGAPRQEGDEGEEQEGVGGRVALRRQALEGGGVGDGCK
jgi:hypothetical protein